jgi:disulfide oxidoreductase YuzD
MSQYIPPIALVKTWLQLVNFSTEKEAKDHSKRMINRNFGSIDLAITYIEQNQPTQNHSINQL